MKKLLVFLLACAGLSLVVYVLVQRSPGRPQPLRGTPDHWPDVPRKPVETPASEKPAAASRARAASKAKKAAAPKSEAPAKNGSGGSAKNGSGGSASAAPARRGGRSKPPAPEATTPAARDS